MPPLTASSFITAWMDQRVKERGLQRCFPCPEKSSDSGPGGYTLVPVWRLEGGQSHNSTVFKMVVTECTSHPQYPDLLCLSESLSFTQQKKHMLVLHFMSVESIGQMWSFTHRPGLLFSTLKGSETPVFHRSNLTHTHYILLAVLRDCVPHTGLLLEALCTISERISVRLMNEPYCKYVSL